MNGVNEEMIVLIGRSGGIYTEVEHKAFNAVLKVYGVEKRDIIGNCRLREFVEARQATCYLLMKYMPTTTNRRVSTIVKRDKETVRYSIKKIKSLASIYSDVKARLEKAEKLMES